MNKIKRGTTWLHKEIEEDFNEKYLYGNLSYATLCKLCFSDMILCNDIDKIEDYSIWDNMEFDREEDENGDYDYPEIYQYYLVEINDYFFEKYKDNFIMTYSDKLNLWILCVDHLGTSWKMVSSGVEIVEEDIEE